MAQLDTVGDLSSRYGLEYWRINRMLKASGIKPMRVVGRSRLYGREAHVLLKKASTAMRSHNVPPLPPR